MIIDDEQLERIRESVAMLADNEHFINYANSLVALRESYINSACDNNAFGDPHAQSVMMFGIRTVDDILDPIKEVFAERY